MHSSRSRRLPALIIMLGLIPLILSCTTTRNGLIRHKRKPCDCPKWSHVAPRTVSYEDQAMLSDNDHHSTSDVIQH